MGNRQRIIDAAVELMNKNGSTVGTTQLTEHLSISPGNLYYHFRNREEILSEVLLRLQRDLDEAMALTPEEVLDARRLAQCFIGGAKVLWNYRFFFSSSLELIMKDEKLSSQYQAFCVRGTGQVNEVVSRARQVSPSEQTLSDDERDMLTENLWVLWTSWPRYTETVIDAHASESEITRSYEHLAFLLKPYLATDFFESVIKHCEELWNEHILDENG